VTHGTTSPRSRSTIARPRGRAASLLALLVTALAIAPSARAQETVVITGDRLSGVVLPVEPLDGDIELIALRGTEWTVDDTKRVLLEGDVIVKVGQNLFEAPSAVVWINRLPSRDGLITQIAIYFDELENPRRRAGLGLAGRSLLITASARGAVRLRTSLLEHGRPDRRPVLRRGEERLALHIRRLVAAPPPLDTRPRVDRPAPPQPLFIPVPGGTEEPPEEELPEYLELPARRDRTPWLRDPGGVVRFTFGAIQVMPGETENVIIATGPLVIEYFARRQSDELAQLTLTAERAVVFTAPGSVSEMATWQIESSKVHGIYLEGNVTGSANDGEYVVRAPRVYYDFSTDQALMVEAVLRTYEREHGFPLYARAEELRQVSRDQWAGRKIRVTTSEFHTGHFSLGAERMTITRRPAAGRGGRGGGGAGGGGPGGGGSGMETHLDARDITLRAGDLPFFAWPRYTGTIDDVPLQALEVGYSDDMGAIIRTSWNLFSLLGTERPEGLQATLKIDGYTDRGPGGGLDFRYDVGESLGRVDLYGVYDDGVDRTSSGRDVPQDGEFRGVALWEHRMSLGRDWELSAQASYISDETFITSWREDDFRNRREYETSAYLVHRSERAAFTTLTKYAVNDFISNDYLLASQQYQVEKLPELTYRRIGDSWFGDAVTYSGQVRASRMRLIFQSGTPEEIGVRGRAFGIPDDALIADSLRAQGLEQKWVTRLDSRHEIAVPTQWGPVQITPFGVARLTAYDDDFDEFSAENDRGDDVTRVFGAIGVRLNTELQHIDNSVESRLFDLHRLRHIVEPSATIWYGAADQSEDDLPVYDLDVESLGTGAAFRLGVRNTFQTQRGGPGRWRSVDVLTISTDVVFNSSDTNRESPSPQFFDYRPEYSQFGEHARASMVWLLSDTLSISGEGTYDMDEEVLARGSVGAELRHTPALSSYVEYRYLNASENELLGVGWDYRLTPKYRIGFRPQWDFEEDDFRSIAVRVTRRFPDFDLVVQVKHDEIRDDTSIGASVGLVEF
jgi:hypothetical protein